ncbi:MAG: ABC transporter permease [Candidatus Latescibacterota bacterium]|jgi:putative ABC transport system permease protein
MMDSLYIAWKYLTYSKARTATLVACIVLIAFLPLALEILLNESERQLVSRAVSTPLVVGAKGSSLDLVMNTIYFGDEVPEAITMNAAERIMESDLALPIPTYVRFRARNHPIVGTTLDYFEFRGLEVARGEMLTMLGDCLLGATTAERLRLKPGDSIVSSPDELFNLGGTYPLKMKVVGVLKKSHSPDDLAVFVDLKTAWVMQGLMHGHVDLSSVTDPQLILERDDKNITGSPKVYEYTEITEDNIDTFHYHGDPSQAPITAVIVVPFDEKSGTILRGRFLSGEETLQIIEPKETIDTLFRSIFQIKSVLDAVILVVGAGTIMALILVFALSLRLRQREIRTIFMIGCRRMTVARLLAAEISIVILLSALICTVLLIVIGQYDNQMVRTLFIR